MNKLLDFLLGISPAPWARGGERRLEWLGWPSHDLALLVLLGIAAAVAGVWWLYRREAHELKAPIRLGLVALRLLVLLGVLAMLLEPAIVFRKTEFTPSNLLVLVDDSTSMDFRDAYADASHAAAVADALKLSGGVKELRRQSRLELARRALAGGLLDKLSAAGDRVVKLHRFAARLGGDPGGPPTSGVPKATTQPDDADRDSTGVGDSVRQAITAYRGQPLAGILLVTDGQSNTGESPTRAAQFAASEGVPVVALAVGTPEGPRNVTVTELEASPVVFVRDPTPVRVLVESRGLNNAPATIVLERSREGGAWEEVARQQITLGQAGQQQSVPFEFSEDRPTRLRLRARIEGVAADVTARVSALPADMRVIRQRIRVLFIAGSTFPEVEFLRNTLLRDSGISASTWLQTADAKYAQPGNPPIDHLPATQEELNEYDCVVMYDPDPNLWPPQFPQLLTEFVARAGGGLIYIAGERETRNNFDRLEDPQSSWLSLLPVTSEPGLYRTEVTMRLSAREAWKLEITPEGQADPIFQFSPNPQQNATILANLPGMYWHYPVTRAKPGATVLARHGDPRMHNEYGQHVLLATQLVGPGRTFFVAFDSTYRWRYLDEQYFDGFWARMIDRAGRSKQLGGRYPYTLSTDRPSYRPGSQVTLQARFDNPSDRDAGLDVLHGEVANGDKPPIAITLSPRAGDAGAFDARFPVDAVGVHEVRVWSGEAESGGAVRAATLQFKVELPALESEHPTVNLAALHDMAKTSGGAVFDLSRVDQVPAAFKVTRVARILEDRHEIWHAPLLYGTILLAVIVEWVLRRRFRMT